MKTTEIRVEIEGMRFDNINHAVIYDSADPEMLFRILTSDEIKPNLEVITGELSTVGWPGDITDIWNRKEKTDGDVKKLRKFYWRNNDAYLLEMIEISREKELKLRLGMVWKERGKRGESIYYNSYACFDTGVLTHVHHKRLLYKDENLVFTPYKEDSINNFIHDRSLNLICWETYGLNPDFGAPSKLPMLKEDAVTELTDQICVAAYWPNQGLRNYVSRAVRRKSDGDRFGLKNQGLVAFVSNSGREAFVMGPSETTGGRCKSKTYAKLTEPGFLICRSRPDGSLFIETHVV